MLAIVVPVYNARTYATNCLRSIADTLNQLGIAPSTQLVLIDDASDPSDEIPQLFRAFKQSCSCEVTAFRFKTRQHYSRACAVGFSLVRERSILLLSHDMVLTPPYLRTLLAVSELDESYGVVRGTSPHVDMFPAHQVSPPFFPYRSYEEIVAFSEYVERTNGLHCVEDPQICGDSFLVTRRVIDRIGTMDARFVGLFGDIDMGLRAQRAGFKLTCAKGAWLHHVGGGSRRDDTRKGISPEQRQDEIWAVTLASYEQFRQKWDPAMSAEYPGSLALDYARLRAAGPRDGADFQPSVTIDSDIVEII